MKIYNNYNEKSIPIKNIDYEVKKLAIKSIAAAKKNKFLLANNHLEQMAKKILLIKKIYHSLLNSDEEISSQKTLLITRLQDQISLLQASLVMSKEIIDIYHLLLSKTP